MNIFKSKLLWLAPIVAILIFVIFSIAFYPAFNPKPKDIPMAIVNQDKGTDIQGKNINIGKHLEDKLMDSNSDAVKWVQVDSEADIKKGMKDQKYYGAAIIEKDFSKHALSKTQNVVMDAKKQEMKDKVQSGEVPAEQAKKMQEKMTESGSDQKITTQKASFKTMVNDGGGTQISQMASQILEGMGDNVNQQITKQSLSILQKQDVDVKASDVQSLTHPVNVSSEKINKISSHQAGGNGPFLMFMPVWMGSILISVLLFFAFRTSNNIAIHHRMIASLGQIAMTIVTAFVGAFAYIYFMEVVLGFDFNNTNTTATFVALAIMGFVGLILGTMTWLGLKSIPIFFLLMFFSMQLVTLPKQMLPDFYQKYIVGWNPFAHYANSLREILYLHEGIQLDTTMWMFIGFMIFGAASTVIAAAIRKHSTKRTEVPS
ncbi:ABC transporter permease [Staphylococcus nepalensis]|uniref:ABC transporter permease n=1 Tax=Staphylococcus nepalensis TaxID=214473 RepID=A0A2T4S9N3_9STAP|nr:ABC transporter permease [Staphylococcus nepalensis]VDG65844.1 YhgE/Pip C-terminal domain-containing protein [Lacrimispora indolis]MBO1212289.1 ABC transporter permease [Staphylococcus nepalensis]MBO1217074.1 ABC transporter permease [Staphylococcus nepalensis]MBO1227766.1 ABC transporter permease [Staphylococcus nepalensis]MBO1235336.1 ABC transporter permease [Staphylococcus nepalensis]